ncbi:MAG: ABC transporter permease [Anaerolineales bacterium]|nr:ABC transporter permease [Anaerolineales bacterium]
MQRHILNSLFQAALVLVGVLVLVFFMVRATGDPATLMLAREASPEQVAAFREKMGFNRPLPVQFVDFVRRAVVGDFGDSLHYRQPAIELILERMPYSVYLATVALIMAVLIAVPLGLLGGSLPGSPVDWIGRLIGLAGQTVPPFWLALLMILFFAVELRWFPTSGSERWNSVIMPAFVLSLGTMGRLVRLTRSAVLEIMGEDYIRTARSKGLQPRVIFFKHALRNAAIPLISVTTVQFGYMLGGAVIVETVFAWPGLGTLTAESIGRRDFPLVQGVAVFTSVVVVALTLLADVFYAVVDPRIRYD